MSEDNESNGIRVQVNISPSQDTLDILALAVEMFGSRHRNAKNRNTAAADILDKFAPVWFELLKQQDAAYASTVEEVRAQAKQGIVRKKR